MSAAPVPKGLRALVVEDESLILMLLEDMLAEIGHNCAFTARRLDAALEAAREAPFDIAILDINFNGATTYAVAEAVAARGLPLIFATGYGVHGIAEPWRSRPILQKPFDSQALAKAIDAAFAFSALSGRAS